MLESMVGIYALILWLLFVKYKVVPVTTYTVCTAIFIGAVGMGVIFVALSVFHPSSDDGRMYSPVVQIVPEVRGVVVEVPVAPNKPLKKGDILFKIDPRPFEIEVNRLRAALAGKNTKMAQLSEQLAAAEATTKLARANLLVSESKNDRQLREVYEQAKVETLAAKERYDLAEAQFERAKKSKESNVISASEFDRTETNFQTNKAALFQAQADERIANENLKSGSASLEGTRQELAKAEAVERQVRVQFQAEIDGMNPEVRETSAMLDKARYDLDSTIVRAPTDGYVPQVVLRPGQMATATRLQPLMMYVVDERPTLVATYPQRVVSDFKPGLKGEATFKQYPGRTFPVTLRRVLSAVPEGELDASGNILSATPASSKGYIPVVFDYDEDVAALNLPIGAQATIAVYTERVHALSILRKIIVRIHSWENFVF